MRRRARAYRLLGKPDYTEAMERAAERARARWQAALVRLDELTHLN